MEYVCASANGTRIANTLVSTMPADVINDIATFYFDDSFGNKGIIKLDLSQPEQIGCEVTVTYREPYADWGINAGTYVFHRDWGAQWG